MGDDRRKDLTTAQVAERLGVSTTTIVSYGDKGLLRFRRLPSGHRRYRPEDVAELVAAGDAA